MRDGGLSVTASHRVKAASDFPLRSFQVEESSAATFTQGFTTELAFEKEARAIAGNVGTVVKQMLRYSSTNGAAQTGRREYGFVSRHRNQTLSTLRPFL